MMLATVSETTRPSRLRVRRYGQASLGFDALLMGASFAICAAEFGNGGVEALIGALLGTAIGAHQAERGDRVRAGFAGAFAGLFVGALFAGFFHTAIAAVI